MIKRTHKVLFKKVREKAKRGRERERGRGRCCVEVRGRKKKKKKKMKTMTTKKKKSKRMRRRSLINRRKSARSRRNYGSLTAVQSILESLARADLDGMACAIIVASPHLGAAGGRGTLRRLGNSSAGGQIGPNYFDLFFKPPKSKNTQKYI